MSESANNENIDISKRNRSRWMLIGVAVLFILPIVGPFFWTPKSFVNHGELIQPEARPLTALKLTDMSGQAAGIEAFQGKWTMVILDNASCDATCRTNLYNIRQVRLTQGRRMKRVQLAWILLSGTPADVDADIQQDYSQVALYNIPVDEHQVINDLFSVESTGPEDGLQRVYFIDPFGNLVMSFAPDQNPKDIQKDLGRLLRVSKAGEDQN